MKQKRDQKKAMKVATENAIKQLAPDKIEIISHALQRKPKREIKPVMIHFMYLNIRVLGDGWNRTLKLEQLEELG